MQWLHNCSQALLPSYTSKGVPYQIAIRKSVQDCACVIDKFRINFSQKESENMLPEERMLFSENYTKECLGIIGV